MIQEGFNVDHLFKVRRVSSQEADERKQRAKELRPVIKEASACPRKVRDKTENDSY